MLLFLAFFECDCSNTIFFIISYGGSKKIKTNHHKSDSIYNIHMLHVRYVYGALPGEWFHYYSNNDIENSHLLSYAKSLLFMDFRADMQWVLGCIMA